MGAALQKLNIERDVFDRIIADKGARQEIAECLLFCLENVPSLEEIASEMLQYIAELPDTNEDAEDGDWVTIKGTHVLVGKGGKAVSGGKLKGMDLSKATSQKSKQSKSGPSRTSSSASRTVVNGSDISKTYSGETDIKSVIKAQGFDGLPKVVSKEEFDEAVKASSFIAQRTYSASSQEILDAYRDQLYNGEWYVECSTGGAQYGQGMYCAADYSGKLTDGIKAEIEHYKSLYTDVMNRSTAISTAKQRIEDGIRQKAKNNLLDRFHPYVDGYDFQQGKWKPEFADEARELKGSNPELYGKVLNQLKGYEEKYDASASSVSKLSTEEIGAAYGFSTRNEQVSYTETMTLDPSANIASYAKLDEQFNGHVSADRRSELEKEYVDSAVESIREKHGEDAALFVRYNYGDSDISWDEANAAAEKLGRDKCKELATGIGRIRSGAYHYVDDYSDQVHEQSKTVREKFSDIGAYAAALGYDAINAENHGASGSYTVILNRTKTIILSDQDRKDADDGIISFQQGEDGVIYAIRNRKVIGWVDVQGAPAEEHTDGGPGSGNHHHAGIPGQVGGSMPQAMTDAAYQASDATDLLHRMIDARMESDGVDKSTARKAVQKELLDIDMFDPDKLDEFIRNAQYSKPVDYSEVDKESAIGTIRDSVPQNVLDGWFRDADSSYKKRLEHLALTDDALRNAGLNIAFDNYKNYVEASTGEKYGGGFDDFLKAEIPVYRCQRSENQKYVEGDDVLAFSFDPAVAKKFGGYMTETKIRPIDTIGSYQTTGESEILVRREKTPLADRQDGGPGSGNFGHEGRPGKLGGSAPGDGPKEKPKGRDPRMYAEPAQITKGKMNAAIDEILGGDRSGAEKIAAVKEELKKLNPGSRIQMPDTWNDDDGNPCIVEMDAENGWDGTPRWIQRQGGEKYGLGSTEDLAQYIVSEYEGFNNRCPVIKSTQSKEEKAAAEEAWQKKYNWRRNSTVWQDGGAFDEKQTVYMQKFDLDNCGHGFEVVGSDGKTYIKDQDVGWVDKDTYKKADRTKLNNVKFEGDFFDVTLGMNGVSKEECGKARSVYNDMDADLRAAYEKQFRGRDCMVELDPKQVSHCDSYGNVHLTPDSDSETVYHEFAHSMDSWNDRIHAFPSMELQNTGGKREQQIKDFEAMAAAIGFETDGNGNFAGEDAKSETTPSGYVFYPSREKKYREYARSKWLSVRGFASVSDAISAMTGSTCSEAIYGSHKAEYWYSVSARSLASTRCSEYWAEYCQLKACKCDDALVLLKQMTPELYAAAEKTYERVIKNG